MTALSLLFSTHYWKGGISASKFFKSFFGGIGFIVTMLEVAKKLWAYHDPNTELIGAFISGHYWLAVSLILFISLFISLHAIWPETRITVLVKERDLTVSIEIGDLFATDDAMVIATNRTFDTDTKNNLIHPKSLQAQYVAKFFKEDSIDRQIDRALNGSPFNLLGRNQKLVGKLKEYPIGTTIKLTKSSRDAYWIALATMNSHGVAGTTLDDFRDAVSAFWNFIETRSGGSPRLRMPVLATGLAKLGVSRQLVIKEILKSFFAACSAGHFCEQLTIVISPKDYLKYQMDIRELDHFLQYLVLYTEFKKSADIGVGTMTSV